MSTQEIPKVDRSLAQPQVSEGAELWARAYTTPPSQTVSAVRAETKTAAPIPQMISGVMEARLLEALALSSGAKRILEIGTFTGATTLLLAEALPADVRITTLEKDEEIAEIAQRAFDGSNVGAKIDLRIGDARELVRELEGPFDLVYIDAWKVHYVDYYDAVLPKLAPRGVIAADDVIWGGLPFNHKATDIESDGIRRFVRHVQDDARVHNVMLTLGEGLLLIWRSPESETP